MTSEMAERDGPDYEKDNRPLRLSRATTISPEAETAPVVIKPLKVNDSGEDGPTGVVASVKRKLRTIDSGKP